MTAPDHMVEPLKIFLHVWGHPYLAPRRGCDQDRRQKALAVARGGSRRHRARILVQSQRDKRAAKRLLRKLLKRPCRPSRVLITDKLASYGAAKKEITPGVEHRQHRGLNSRTENSH